MVRKSLLVATLLATAVPLAAQEEPTWSSTRPDAFAPLGIAGGRSLAMGQFEIAYRFTQMNSKGVWYQTDSLSLDETFDLYPVAPLALEDMRHTLALAYAPHEDFTVLAEIGYAQLHREQYTEDGLFYATDADELGDLEVTGRYTAFSEGRHRAYLQLGALIPTGTADVRGETPFSTPDEEALPYDMRPGAGTFGVIPGLSIETQNEFGTVGAQFRALLRFGTNDLEYRLGNRYETDVWAAYRLNDFFAVTARAHYVKWNGLEGYDTGLDPLRDPGNEAYFRAGRRVDVPVGVNLFMPEDTRFAGHRLALEWIFPVHQKYDGPQLGADWGVVAGWHVVF